MDCENCKKDEVLTIPKYAYERERAKDEMTVRRLYRIIIALSVSIVLVVAGFLVYLYQYDFFSSETVYTQDGEGVNIIGDQNGVTFDGPKSSSTQEVPN